MLEQNRIERRVLTWEGFYIKGLVPTEGLSLDTDYIGILLLLSYCFDG